MNLTKIAKLAALSALFAAGAAQAAGPNLIQNGDFELAAANVAAGSYTTVVNGSSLIPSWTIGATSVDLISGSYGAINNISVDLLGTPGPGQIAQLFSATAGTTYQLDFDLFRNGNADPSVTVSFGTTTQSFLSTGAVPQHFSLFYTASVTDLATLQFDATGSGNGGSVLDNVSVSAVPEPETYAMMLAGLGLLGFMARRRKQNNAA